jgi:hypothetical protein
MRGDIQGFVVLFWHWDNACVCVYLPETLSAAKTVAVLANSVELCVCFPFSISCKENVSESFFR